MSHLGTLVYVFTELSASCEAIFTNTIIRSVCIFTEAVLRAIVLLHCALIRINASCSTIIVILLKVIAWAYRSECWRQSRWNHLCRSNRMIPNYWCKLLLSDKDLKLSVRVSHPEKITRSSSTLININTFAGWYHFESIETDTVITTDRIAASRVGGTLRRAFCALVDLDTVAGLFELRVIEHQVAHRSEIARPPRACLDRIRDEHSTPEILAFFGMIS